MSVSFQADAIASSRRGRCIRNGPMLPKFQNVFVIDPQRKKAKRTQLVKTAYEMLSYRMCFLDALNNTTQRAPGTPQP